MPRLVLRALSLALLLLPGAASAHPGHAMPHLLNEGDAALGWWVFAAVAAASTVAWLLGNHRS